MKDLLQSLIALSEGETKDTKTGRVHKGTYGSEYETDKDGNEKKKDAPAVKKGRGRPKKDSDASGEVKSYDTKSLGSVFGGGQKPKKEVGTVSKKHSLKEYMESVEDTKEAEAVMEGMFGGVDHSNIAANLGKLAKVIKSVQTPEQFAVAQKYAQRMSGTIMNHQHDKMGFGSGIRANLGVMRDIQADLKSKAAELGIEYNQLEETGQIEIKPASQTQTQVIQQGDRTLGTVNNPQLAAQIKQSIGKGEMTLSPDEEMNEGKKPDFLDMDKDGDKKEPMKKAVADKKKNPFAKKKVAEGRDLESSEYLDEKVAKVLAREKPGMDTVKSNDAFYGAVYNELIACGLTPKAARYKVSYDEDFISDVASAYAHYQKNPALDEGSIEDFTQHALAEPTQRFTKPGGSMAQPRGTPTQANRPVPNPTAWGTDPIAAATDRAFNFVSSLGKGTKFTKESNEDMKDVQFESWSKQLNGLLTEGITVSSSQGQQGSPDSVSVTATDNDAQSLMSVLRNAGIGGFGAEQAAPEIGYGVAQGGEEDFNGTGTEPQPSPDVVGDDGDMLSMLKKMAGLSAGPVGSGSEESQDYEDEEGQEDGALEPTDSGEEGSEDSSEEDSSEEDEVEEGNKFTGNLAKARDAGKEEADLDGDGDMEKVKEGILGSLGGAAAGMALGGPIGAAVGAVGGQEATDGGSSMFDEEDEHTCNECGGAMYEGHSCGEEQVEEAFANEPDEEMAKLKALLSMGNDLHKMKRDQTVGNPTQVRESINEWKKLSGIIR